MLKPKEMSYPSISGNGAHFDLAEASKTIKGIVAGQKMFARYELEKILGRGGMGVVWLARDQRLDRVIALKVLPDEVFYDLASREDLKNETRKSLELTHSNIVRIHDFAEDEGAAAISMEYVDGATLSHWRLQAKNKILEANVLGPWILEICDALQYAHHSAKLVHRDLKPANVMVNGRNQVKITDFGIACSLRNSLNRVSIRQNSSGTLVYMSPEQMMGEAPTPQDDIYALGATIYETMTSKPPFYEKDIALQVCKVDPVSMAERRLQLAISGKAIPKAWEETVARCLSKDPGKRPASMSEMAGMLGLFDQPVWKRQQFAKTKWSRYEGIKRTVANLRKNKTARMAAMTLALAFAAAAGALPGFLFSTGNNTRSAQFAAPRPPTPHPQEPPPATVSPVVESQSGPPAFAAPSAVGDKEFLLPPAKDGRLEISTTPTGLHYQVFRGSLADLKASKPEARTPMLDGTTPAELHDLERGKYTVVCEREGWDDDVREVQVGAETSRVEAVFPGGILAIKSVPTGAEVLLDGESIGVTPLSMEAAPGDHEITATSGRKPEQDEDISITAGKQTSLVLRFETTARKHKTSHKKKPPTGWQKLSATLGKIFGTSTQGSTKD